MQKRSEQKPRNLTLIEQVQVRRDEMAKALAEDGPDRAEIEVALAKLEPMLTGDLDNLPDMVSRDLVRWLETNRHLAVRTPAQEAARAVQADAQPVVRRTAETYDADKSMAEPTGAAPTRPGPGH